MKCDYKIGTCKKTREIAIRLNGTINRALEAGDFVEAERLIDEANKIMNIPLRMEFLYVAETQDVFAS